MDISKHGKPIKSTLKNFSSGFLGGKMPPTSIWVTKTNNWLKFIVWYTTTNHLIRAILVKVWVIPHKNSHILKKILSIIRWPLGRNLAWNQVIRYICKPRSDSMSNRLDGKKLIIRKVFWNRRFILVSAIHRETRQVISYHIFWSLLIPYFQIEHL